MADTVSAVFSIAIKIDIQLSSIAIRLTLIPSVKSLKYKNFTLLMFFTDGGSFIFYICI